MAKREGKRLSAEKKRSKSKIVWACIGLICLLALGFTPPPEGLTARAMWSLGMLACAVAFWSGNVLPDYVTALLLAMGWIVGTKIPPNLALGAFASSTNWLLMSALVFATALKNTGLVRRLALWLLTVLPATYGSQVLGLMLIGTALGSVIPNGIARLTVLGPIAIGIGEQSGYAPRSPGMNGLTLGVWGGAGVLACMAFLTGSAPNLAIFAALPEAVKQQISWLDWLVAAIPLTIFMGLVFYFAIRKIYRTDTVNVSVEGIRAQLNKLGPMSKQEKYTGIVLLLALLLWMTGNIHKIDPAWVALGGATVLLLLNIVDREGFQNGVNWVLLVYIAVIQAIGSVMTYFKLDSWILKSIGPSLSRIAANPLAFIVLAVILMFIGRFIFVSMITVGILLILILGPVAQNAGISPFLFALLTCGLSNIWTLPYLNVMYLSLYSSTQGNGFTHEQARKLDHVYMIAGLIGAVLSVPYWKFLGYIK